MYVILLVLIPVVLITLGGMFFLSLMKGPVFIREVVTSQSHRFGSDTLGNYLVFVTPRDVLVLPYYLISSDLGQGDGVL